MSLLSKIVPVEKAELRPVLLATAYGFSILLSYYILRAVRDEISAADRGNLQVLWTAVFLVMLVAVPAYSTLVARYSRQVFIPVANRFFALNLLAFYVALELLPLGTRLWLDRVFYVWSSVFALFVVTVFWGFIADLFRNAQGKRLFGFIALGSSLGGIVGSLITATLATVLPAFSLLLIAAIPLEAAAWIAKALHRGSTTEDTVLRAEPPELIHGTAFSGIKVVFGSSYLMKIAGYIALMTFASTVFYFAAAELIGEAITDRDVRTAFYAKIDLAVNAITILTQSLLTAHIIRRVGVALSLATLPIMAFVGFFTLGLSPLLGVLVTAWIAYRSCRYAIAKPTREILFTVVSREQRYKSKAFVDTAVYRGGDLLSGWAYTGLAYIGLSIGAIALVAVPLVLIWAGLSLRLGRQQEELVQPLLGYDALGSID
jgi:AAA family ATP:ADP antiporter